jgi:hypothetical protein
LLYHTGPDGTFEGGKLSFPSRQPWEVAESLVSCPECGHKLNHLPDPDTVKVHASFG